jgi:hypothetical protein
MQYVFHAVGTHFPNKDQVIDIIIHEFVAASLVWALVGCHDEECDGYMVQPRLQTLM